MFLQKSTTLIYAQKMGNFAQGERTFMLANKKRKRTDFVSSSAALAIFGINGGV